ncbi:GspE/PulE family protein [Bremerella sp. T1]|uniref:GspE/PulE family protein n=1 Tax=Bremerella sp. TYQ1 TaxID=3119568 RepID=UPI001CD02ADD|nr:ATPase, T2SS/T4P/T4SS family [Bremerella volcania]UBM38452.1 Flp pilus assembly complex ATPase component TadA [Bremerella volcania]
MSTYKNNSHGIDFSHVDLASLDPEAQMRLLIEHASMTGASDLFIFAGEPEYQVAMRLWGRMRNITRLPASEGKQLLNYVKALAGIDITERRRPQDGRWIYRDDEKVIDLRLNLIPTREGEDLTIRLLDRKNNLLSIDQIGLGRHDRNALMEMLQSESGLVLVTGPTGTGKTTTLYACLQHLNDGNRKINTLEDPIEFSLPGIRQSQVNTKVGLDFPELLRGVIRQQPDIIMVGEIRDKETAVTAVRAANSGHLVFATLHAPVATGAVQSMLSFDIHPYFLASCLRGVIAQRLVRVLDPESRMKYELGATGNTFADIEPLLEEGQGTYFYGPDPSAENEGYCGRTAIFEMVTINRTLRDAIINRKPTLELEQLAEEMGMITFRKAAMLKVAQGETSMEEVFKSIPVEYLDLETTG